MNLRTALFKSRQNKKDKLRFNSNGSSMLSTLLGVATAVVMIAIVTVLFQISGKVNDINTGKVADGRLSADVTNYNDPAPTFQHWVKAPGFIGELKGNADTATALMADPSDCYGGSFADSIDAQGNLGCSTDGSNLTGVNAVTLGGLNVSDFQNATNMNTGTVSDSRLSAKVTLQGNAFNGDSQLVQLTSTGALPALDGAALNNLNASNLMIGTVNDARLSNNVALYNATTPTFNNPVTAPAFNGQLNGNATTATALAADPADCAIGAFAEAISATGDLSCSTDGGSLVNLNASNIASGTLADARLSANVTMQGNTFNGANQLVQLDNAGALPAVDGSHLTNVTAANFTGNLSGDVTGTQNATVVSIVPDAALSSNVVLFDGSHGLDFTGAGVLTADSFQGDGSALTNLTGANVTGVVANAQTAVNFTGALAGDVTGTQGATIVSTVPDAALSANVTMQGNTFNGANQLVQLTAGDLLPALDGSNLTNLTGANVSGTVANATTAVNFTGALAGDVTGTQGLTVVSHVNDSALSSNVVLLDGSHGLDFTGAGPITADAFQGDGSALTNLTGANVTGVVANATTAVNFTGALAGDVTGTQGATVVSHVSDAALSTSVTLQGNTFNGANQLVQLTAGGILPALDGSNLTNITGANVTGTVANAATANALAVDPADCVAGSFANAIAANGDLTCSNDGSLLVNLDASNIASGTLADARLSNNVTLKGNTFNGANQLVMLDAGGLLPALDGSALTNLTGANVTGVVPNAQTAVNFTGALVGDVTGTQGATVVSTVSDSALSANVTKQGNTFNGANQLVQLTAGGILPVLDGSNLTNLTGANVTGTVANATTAVNFTGALAGDVTGTQGLTVVSHVSDSALSGNVTLKGNTFNGANGLVELDATGKLPALDGSALTGITVATAAALTNDPVDCPAGQYAQLIAANGDLTCNNDGSQLANLNAGNITAGTLNDARLSANVTLGGNNFNLASGLVQLDATGKLPALDGSALTNVSTTNFSGNLAGDVTGPQSATVVAHVSDSAISVNVTKQGNTFNGINELVQLDGSGSLPALNGSALTNLTGANVTGTVANATNALTANALGADPVDCVAGSYANAIAANGDLTCSNDASGLVNINANNISSGTLSDLRLSGNVTLAGNTFNGANQLVELTGVGSLPALDGSALTNLTGANVTGTVASATTATNANHATTADSFTVNPADCTAGQYAQAIASNGDLTCNNDASALVNINAANISSGTLSDSRLSTNVTLAGNTFNGANQLVKLDGASKLPAVNGSNVTNITGANVTGTVANATTANTANTAIALAVNPADCTAGSYANAIAANGDLSCSNDGSQLANLNAANITSGTVNDLRLSANVTLAGNTFNGANQLVKLNGGGSFTALDAGNLTNLNGGAVQGNISGNASNVTGVVGDANVANNLTINGGAIDNTAIGATTASTGRFTTLNTSGAATLNSLSVTTSATVGTTLTVTGATTLNGATQINNTLGVTGLATLATLTVSGATIHNGTTTFNNTVTSTSSVNFTGATSVRMPTTALNLVDGVTNCTAAGTGAITFSTTNGSFFGCDGSVWQKLDN